MGVLVGEVKKSWQMHKWQWAEGVCAALLRAPRWLHPPPPSHWGSWTPTCPSATRPTASASLPACGHLFTSSSISRHGCDRAPSPWPPTPHPSPTAPPTARPAARLHCIATRQSPPHHPTPPPPPTPAARHQLWSNYDRPVVHLVLSCHITPPQSTPHLSSANPPRNCLSSSLTTKKTTVHSNLPVLTVQCVHYVDKFSM